MKSASVATTIPIRSRRRVLLGSMLKVGLIGFGGGSALIPVIEDELVRRRRGLDETQFTRHAVVASITPGALPVKLAGLAGLELSGAWLAALMAVAVAVPGTAVAVALVATVASAGAEVVRYVQAASVGITVFIIGLLLQYITDVYARSVNRVAFRAIVLATALATGVPTYAEMVGTATGHRLTASVPTLTAAQVIGAAIVGITLRALFRRRHACRPAVVRADDSPLWAVARSACFALLLLAVAGVAVAGVVCGPRMLGFLGLVATSTLSSFGGGEAYVAVASGYFVQGGYVSSDVFYTQLVPIGNALPGPILVKLAAEVGFVTAGPGPGGWILATAAALVAIGVCTSVAVIVMAAYRRLQASPVLADVAAYILPVIAGLLVSTSASMLNASASVAASADASPPLVMWLSLAAVAAVFYFRCRKLIPDPLMLLACGAVSTAAMLLL